MWYVYILQASNKSLYTGATTDLKRRMKQHGEGKGAKFTRNFGFQKLLFSQEFPDRSQALKREAQIKSWTRLQKLALINSQENQYGTNG